MFLAYEKECPWPSPHRRIPLPYGESVKSAAPQPEGAIPKRGSPKARARVQVPVCG